MVKGETFFSLGLLLFGYAGLIRWRGLGLDDAPVDGCRLDLLNLVLLKIEARTGYNAGLTVRMCVVLRERRCFSDVCK